MKRLNVQKNKLYKGYIFKMKVYKRERNYIISKHQILTKRSANPLNRSLRGFVLIH